MKLLNILLELNFKVSKDNTYQWELIKEDSDLYRYQFNSAEKDNTGMNYFVSFTLRHYDEDEENTLGPGVYERDYRSERKKFDLTGEGKALKINATVMDITLDFLKRNKYWNIVVISPLNKKRYNLVKQFLDNNISKNLYKVETDFMDFMIKRRSNASR